MAIIIKSPQEIELMRQAGRIVAAILEIMVNEIRPGITTARLDSIAVREVKKHKAIPSFKGYRGFPATLCTSLNEEIVHGIPSRARKLATGDVLSIDLGVRMQGFYGDSAVTVPVGEVDAEVLRLLEVTREALGLAIDQCVPGNRIGDLSHAVQTHVERAGFSVVREFVGHGVGSSLHEEPQIPNFGAPGVGVRLRPGMVLAIEPMVNMGGCEVQMLEDGWTAVAADRKPSAHFEHSVAITEDGPWVLSESLAKTTSSPVHGAMSRG